MKSISRTEFRDNLKKYFDLAENECIIIHKGVKKAYILMPFSAMEETDFLKASKSNLIRLRKSIREYTKEDLTKSSFKNKADLHLTTTALKDYMSWKATRDKRIMSSLHHLLLDIANNPEEGLGNPQLLKGEFSGFWSRSLNTEHRIIYRRKDDKIVILSMQYYYDEEED